MGSHSRHGFIVVVSGIPRAGTSMLMQMLQAGGFPILTDQVRLADEDNPRGYLEYEKARTLRTDSEWVKDATGMAVKIVAPLIPYLPQELEYRVIFAERNLDEAIASQAQMLIRRGRNLPDTSERREKLKASFADSTAKAKVFLRAIPRVRLLEVERGWVLRNPGEVAAAMNAFVDGGLDETAMAAAVDPLLNRFGFRG